MSDKNLKERLARTERQLERALALFTISSELHKTLNLDEVYQIILDTLKQIIGVKSASILLRDEKSGELEVAASIDERQRSREVEMQRSKEAEGQRGKEVEKQEVAVRFIAQGKQRSKEPARQEKFLVRYNLKLENKTIGEIHIHSLLSQKKELTKEDEELLTLLADQAAVAITGAMLYTYSTEGLAALRDKLDKTIKAKVSIPERKLTPDISKKLNPKYTQIMKSYLKTGDLAKEDDAVFDICGDLIEYDIPPKGIITLHLKVASDMARSIEKRENQRIVLAARMVLLKVMTSYASLYREHYMLAAGEGKVIPARPRKKKGRSEQSAEKASSK